MDNGEFKEKPPFHGFEYHQPGEAPFVPSSNGNRNGKPNGDGADGPLSIVVVLFSTIVLGIAMISGAFVAAKVIWLKDKDVMDHIFPTLAVIGLTYIVGWVVALIGLRSLDTFFILPLPFVIRLYTWGTLSGILILYFVVLQRLYWQAYDLNSFLKYTLVMAAAFGGLLGFHLLVKNHSLRPLAVPLLIFVLGQMALIVFHYVFAEELIGKSVKYDYLKYDLLFLSGMFAIGGMMIAHVGILAGVRSAIDGVFEEKPNGEKDT